MLGNGLVLQNLLHMQLAQQQLMHIKEKRITNVNPVCVVYVYVCVCVCVCVCVPMSVLICLHLWVHTQSCLSVLNPLWNNQTPPDSNQIAGVCVCVCFMQMCAWRQRLPGWLVLLSSSRLFLMWSFLPLFLFANTMCITILYILWYCKYLDTILQFYSAVLCNPFLTGRPCQATVCILLSSASTMKMPHLPRAGELCIFTELKWWMHLYDLPVHTNPALYAN